MGGIRVAKVQRIALTGIHLAVLVGILNTVVDAIAVGIRIQRICFCAVLLAIVIGIFHTVGQVVCIGIGIQRIGIRSGIVLAVTTGFHVVNYAISVAVRVGIERIHVVNVGHTVVVVVRILEVGHTVAVAVAGSDGWIRHTAIGIVRVVVRIRGRIVGCIAVTVVVNGRTVSSRWIGVAGIQRIGKVVGFRAVGNHIAVAVAGGVVIVNVVHIGHAVAVVVGVHIVGDAVAVEVTEREGGIGIAGIQWIGFTRINHAVQVGIFGAV